jgi:hypothetical protein
MRYGQILGAKLEKIHIDGIWRLGKIFGKNFQLIPLIHLMIIGKKY